jgi:hypothetical protein
MHYEILVEDPSGAKILEAIVPKVIPTGTTFEVHRYRGIGHIPKGLRPDTDPRKRLLLQQLPRLVRGFGATFAGYGTNYAATLVVVCDLDSRCKVDFKAEITAVVQHCHPRPRTIVCFGVEEMEAWLLGDRRAVEEAYPNASKAVLDSYESDSICDTWELLADAIHPGGRSSLKQGPYQLAGEAKSEWATSISPLIVVERNVSPSFRYFCSKLQDVRA